MSRPIEVVGDVPGTLDARDVGLDVVGDGAQYFELVAAEVDLHSGLHRGALAPFEKIDLCGSGDLGDRLAILVDDFQTRPLPLEAIGQVEDHLTDMSGGLEIVIGQLTGSYPPDDRANFLFGQLEGDALELRHHATGLFELCPHRHLDGDSEFLHVARRKQHEWHEGIGEGRAAQREANDGGQAQITPANGGIQQPEVDAGEPLQPAVWQVLGPVRPDRLGELSDVRRQYEERLHEGGQQSEGHGLGYDPHELSQRSGHE
jgi:hypothetical protein